MSLQKTLVSRLGRIEQLAFVPKDFDGALKYWTETMGVGPFFYSNVKADACTYMGKPSDIQFSLAIGYWGDTQIELVQQHNDAPSIYKAWTDAGREGLHHVCVFVDDLAKARAVCDEAGADVVQEVKLGPAGAIYVDTGGGPGTLLEILQLGAAGRAGFDMMREAARTWNGEDPVRGR